MHLFYQVFSNSTYSHRIADTWSEVKPRSMIRPVSKAVVVVLVFLIIIFSRIQRNKQATKKMKLWLAPPSSLSYSHTTKQQQQLSGSLLGSRDTISLDPLACQSSTEERFNIVGPDRRSSAAHLNGPWRRHSPFKSDRRREWRLGAQSERPTLMAVILPLSGADGGVFGRHATSGDHHLLHDPIPWSLTWSKEEVEHSM